MPGRYVLLLPSGDQAARHIRRRPGPQWDGGWQADPEPDDRPIWAGYSWPGWISPRPGAGRQPGSGIGRTGPVSSCGQRTASSVAEAEGIGTTRYAVMQKPPVWLFLPAGLLITGVPVGVEPAEVQAELLAGIRAWRLLAGCGRRLHGRRRGRPRHEIIAETEQRFAGDPRGTKSGSSTGSGLSPPPRPAYASSGTTGRTCAQAGWRALTARQGHTGRAAADRKRRIRELRWSLTDRLAD